MEAVVDKDHASALLAAALDADWLVLLTDVGAVWTRWPPPAGHPIRHASPAELSPGRFEAGTMSPKVEAACAFVRETGARAAIGALDQLSSILEGNAGTLIDTDGKRGLELYPQDG